MARISKFEDIEAWQKARELTNGNRCPQRGYAALWASVVSKIFWVFRLVGALADEALLLKSKLLPNSNRFMRPRF